jgi:AraC-like DNA-binding protein
VRVFTGAGDIPRARLSKQPKALGYDFYSVLGTNTLTGCLHIAADQTVRGQVLQPVLHLMQPAGTVYRVGRRVLPQTGATSAILVAPEWEFTRVSPPGTLLGIKIDPSVLHDELASRCPLGSAGWSLSLEALAMTQAEKAGLMTAATRLVHATRPGGESPHLAHAEGLIVALVADLVLREAAAWPAGSLSLARVVDLEDWIDAHLDTPISLGRLCQVAGVGERCLQKAFERRRGMSPMRFVTERRILAAYQRLAHAGLAVSVTAVALELGFEHLGRFAHLYRHVIGESPSQTLATRRPAAEKSRYPVTLSARPWQAQHRA